MSLPTAEIGDIVYWYPDADHDATPHPAIVTSDGQYALTLNVMGPDLKTFRIHTGVLHIDHPKARREETREDGAWDHTPGTKRLKELEAAFGTLKE
jgi:hypothetical protein